MFPAIFVEILLILVDEMSNSFAMIASGKIAVIERDKTYQSCSAMLSAGGIRQQFSVPENIEMSKYGAEFLKNMDALGESLKKSQVKITYRMTNWIEFHSYSIGRSSSRD